jgi:beta-barrel assembly-enhancing protease
VGKDVAAYLCARYGLLRDEAATRYLTLVGRAVARKCDRPELAWHFGLLDTEEVNAYAAPGGYVFVTRGLMRLVKDESELAGVLAHEVAHIAKRHAVKEIQKGNLLQGGIELAAARKDSPEAFKAVSDFTIQLLFKGYARQDEVEADRAAPEYAASSGYDPAGLGRVLARLSEGKKDENRFKALNKSHPPAKDRLKTVADKLSGQSWKAGLVANDARFFAETLSLR